VQQVGERQRRQRVSTQIGELGVGLHVRAAPTLAPPEEIFESDAAAAGPVPTQVTEDRPEEVREVRGAGISAARTGVNRLLRGASSPGTATATTTSPTTATPVVWREILSEMVMQIEASAIPFLRKRWS